MKNENELIKNRAKRYLTAKGCRLMENLIQKGIMSNSIVMGGMIIPNRNRMEVRQVLTTAFKDLVFNENKSYSDLNALVKSIKVTSLTPIEILETN